MYSELSEIEVLIEDSILNNYIDAEDKDVWVIGDVHGCGREFKLILEELRAKSPDGYIFQLGDLIDRGPDLYDVFKLMEEYNVYGCIGNHELNFIQEHFGYKKCRSRPRFQTHKQFEALSKEKQEFVLSSIMKQKNMFGVEIGTNQWALSHSPSKHFSIIHDVGNASSTCMNNVQYTEEDSFGVHGHMHWAYTPIEDQIDKNKNKCFNVDAGCCYGNYLLALNLKTLEYIKIKAKTSYATIEERK